MNEEPAKQELPTYLNKLCIQNAIKKARGVKYVHLGNLQQWKLLNNKGGNYCSNIYRFNGTFRNLWPDSTESQAAEEQSFDLFIKDMDIEIAKIGTNEKIMLEIILPEMTRILESIETADISETSNKLAADCYLTQSNAEHEFYILEDLNTLGYELPHRYYGLSESKALIVLGKLAKFHAASMVYAEKYPDVIANLNRSNFANDATADLIGRALDQKSMECAMKILQRTDEEIVKKMKRLATKFDEKIKDVVNPANSLFNVLNHGDLWVNNILLKEDQTKSDAIFVDFQDVFWGSPACDLNHILHTSLQLVTLQTQRYKLIAHYYKKLKAFLERLNYKKIPTWCDLLKELKRCALSGYYATICEYPFCVMRDEAAKKFKTDFFLESETLQRSIFVFHADFIWHGVLYFEEIGLFDESHDK